MTARRDAPVRGVAALGSISACTATSACCNSRPEAKRASGRLASARVTTCASAGGVPGASDTTDGGSTCIVASSTAQTESAANGPRPVSIWNSTAPSPNTSDGGPAGCPCTCSGAMYPGVPATIPGALEVAPSVGTRVTSSGSAVRRAMPKSSTLTRPAAAMITLAGLMSRCTIPWACASASASAISMA